MLAFGCAMIVQAVVSQRSIRPTPFVASPTAKQRLADAHATPLRSPVPGTVAFAHEVPFHRSINGAPETKPTAKQFDAGWQVTASRWALAGFGVVTTDQEDPDHWSMKVGRV